MNLYKTPSGPFCMANGRPRAARIALSGRRDRTAPACAMTKREMPSRSSTPSALRSAPNREHRPGATLRSWRPDSFKLRNRAIAALPSAIHLVAPRKVSAVQQPTRPQVASYGTTSPTLPGFWTRANSAPLPQSSSATAFPDQPMLSWRIRPCMENPSSAGPSRRQSRCPSRPPVTPRGGWQHSAYPHFRGWLEDGWTARDCRRGPLESAEAWLGGCGQHRIAARPWSKTTPAS